MKLSGKKLTTAILAGLMGASMFGGSVFAEVTDQEFNEVRQGVNSNTQRISQLENAQQQAKDYSTDIAANKTAISDEATAPFCSLERLFLNHRVEIQPLRPAVWRGLSQGSPHRRAVSEAD